MCVAAWIWFCLSIEFVVLNKAHKCPPPFRYLRAKQITLHVPPEALAVLVDLGWNPEYGARPLKRTIQKELEAPLARALLSGEVCYFSWG